MTGQSFFQYIDNVFHLRFIQTNIEFPILLFVDGLSGHLLKVLSDFFVEKQIKLALYPNATNILQPLDVVLFHPLSM